MKEFFKKIWAEIKRYWNLFVIYIKLNWKHWLTLGLTKLIEIINNKKTNKRLKEEAQRHENEINSIT